MNNQNLILAVILSLGVLFGFHTFYDKPRAEAQRQAQLEARLHAQTAVPVVASSTPAAGTVSAPTTAESQPVTADRAGLVAAGFAKGERIAIDTPRLKGSLNLRGARLDDVALADYRVTPDKDAAPVILMSPANTAAPDYAYYAQFGWLAGDAATKVPDADTLWKADRQTLTKDQPVTLTWDNGAGLTFTRTLAIDDNFMFTATDTVANKTAAPVSVYPFGLIARHAVPPKSSVYLLHEGPLGVFNGTLDEVKYKNLKEEKQVEKTTTAGGWLGLTDKYWLTALVPDQSQPMVARMTSTDAANDMVQTDARGPAITIAPNESGSATQRVFIGAKEVKLLDAYADKLGVKNFDLAVDFGWFYFLTKPYFHAIDDIALFFKHTGYGFACAILIFTVILKLAFMPLQAKSYRSMNRMREVQPRMVELRERWAHDKQRLNVEMFALYRQEKINPASGCWPMLVQVPIFFALYKVLYVTIEMRHAPFPGWIRDLSAPDPTSVFNLFGLIPWTPPHFLLIGIWPVLMGITMALQQRLNPPPADPVQQTMFRWLPVFFTVLMAQFPAGLVIYWTWSNVLGILQQMWIRREKPAKEITAGKA